MRHDSGIPIPGNQTVAIGTDHWVVAHSGSILQPGRMFRLASKVVAVNLYAGVLGRAYS